MSQQPFLEVLTRHYVKRPNFLKHNSASLATLTNPDWVHTLIVDEVGIGVPAANLLLRNIAPHLIGQWIWILDDDDICIYPNLVSDIKTCVSQNIDVVMLRSDCTAHNVGVIPSKSWGTTPVFADVGMSCFVVRNNIYQQFAYAFPESLGADFSFISEVFNHIDSINRVMWYDVIASRSLRYGKGRPE